MSQSDVSYKMTHLDNDSFIDDWHLKFYFYSILKFREDLPQNEIFFSGVIYFIFIINYF